MRKFAFLFSVLALLAIFFTSCVKEQDPTDDPDIISKDGDNTEFLFSKERVESDIKDLRIDFNEDGIDDVVLTYVRVNLDSVFSTSFKAIGFNDNEFGLYEGTSLRKEGSDSPTTHPEACINGIYPNYEINSTLSFNGVYLSNAPSVLIKQGYIDHKYIRSTLGHPDYLAIILNSSLKYAMTAWNPQNIVGYLPVRLHFPNDATDEYHYGWIKLGILIEGDNYSYVYNGYGYRLTPNVSIQAGDI